MNLGKRLDWRRGLVETGKGLESVGGESSWNILYMKLTDKINHQIFLKYIEVKRW